MPVGTKLVGDKMRDTPIGEPQQEDQTQMPLDSQGPDLTPPSPSGMVLGIDGKGTILFLIFFLFFIMILNFFCFLEVEGEASSSCEGGMETYGISPSSDQLGTKGGN